MLRLIISSSPFFFFFWLFSNVVFLSLSLTHYFPLCLLHCDCVLIILRFGHKFFSHWINHIWPMVHRLCLSLLLCKQRPLVLWFNLCESQLAVTQVNCDSSDCTNNCHRQLPRLLPATRGTDCNWWCRGEWLLHCHCHFDQLPTPSACIVMNASLLYCPLLITSVGYFLMHLVLKEKLILIHFIFPLFIVEIVQR